MSAPLRRTPEEATLELAYRSYCAHLRDTNGKDRELWSLADGFGEEVVVACEARRWLEVYQRRNTCAAGFAGQGDPRAEAAEWLRACAGVWLMGAAAVSERTEPDAENRRLARERSRRNADLYLKAARSLERVPA